MSALQGEAGHELHVVQRHVELVVHHRARGLQVGDVEDALVRPAREAGADHVPHRRTGAVAAREVRGLVLPDGAARVLEPRLHPAAVLGEIDEGHRPLDLDAGPPEVLDQEPLVAVLRADEHEGERAQAPSHVPEHGAGHLAAADPHVHGREGKALGQERVGQSHLPIELERARVHDQGARRRARLRRGVDDAHAHAAADEAQGEHEAGGTGAADEDVDAVGLAQGALHSADGVCARSRRRARRAATPGFSTARSRVSPGSVWRS